MTLTRIGQLRNLYPGLLFSRRLVKSQYVFKGAFLFTFYSMPFSNLSRSFKNRASLSLAGSFFFEFRTDASDLRFTAVCSCSLGAVLCVTIVNAGLQKSAGGSQRTCLVSQIRASKVADRVDLCSTLLGCALYGLALVWTIFNEV